MICPTLEQDRQDVLFSRRASRSRFEQGELDIQLELAGPACFGATVFLPVERAGAGLYFGDCKAAMGAGEIVCAPEVGTRIIASATPVPRPSAMHNPRIRTDSHLTTVVSANALADACRIAFRELKLWLEQEWALPPDDAAVIMGIGADCMVCQISNALHTASCTIGRALLPPAD